MTFNHIKMILKNHENSVDLPYLKTGSLLIFLSYLLLTHGSPICSYGKTKYVLH